MPMIPTVTISDQSVTYREGDDKPEIILLDFRDFFQNLGAIPWHRIYDGPRTIADILRGFKDEFESAIGKRGTESELVLESESFLSVHAMLLVIALYFRQSFTGYKVRKILEIGCGEGALSYFLAKATWMTHKENKVFYLSEALQDERFRQVVANLGETGTNLNVLTTDAASDLIRDDYFDFTIINGSEWMREPETVVRNAIRVTKKGGYLLCLSQRQYLSGGCFGAQFNDYVEYPVNDAYSLVVKVIAAEDKESLGLSGIDKRRAQLKYLFSVVRPIIADPSAYSDTEVREAITILSKIEDLVIEMIDHIRDLDVKNQINSVKETLLDYLYTGYVEYREQCRRRLQNQDAVSGLVFAYILGLRM